MGKAVGYFSKMQHRAMQPFSLFGSRQEVIEPVDQRITGTTDHRTMCMILIILEHTNRPELSCCMFQHVFELSARRISRNIEDLENGRIH
jgi:hypothetical protein